MNMLTVRAAARASGVSDTTIRRWIKCGALKVVRPLPRGMILIPESELLRVLEVR